VLRFFLTTPPNMPGFAKMIWPVNSPHLNSIENVWHILKYCIDRRFPKTLDQLRQYLIEEWDSLDPQDYLKYIKGDTRAVRGSDFSRGWPH
jgi:hypothetical protein